MTARKEGYRESLGRWSHWVQGVRNRGGLTSHTVWFCTPPFCHPAVKWCKIHIRKMWVLKYKGGLGQLKTGVRSWGWGQSRGCHLSTEESSNPKAVFKRLLLGCQDYAKWILKFFIIYSFFKIINVCEVWPPSLYIQHVHAHAWRGHKRALDPLEWGSNNCVSPCGCWERNLGPRVNLWAILQPLKNLLKVDESRWEVVVHTPFISALGR